MDSPLPRNSVLQRLPRATLLAGAVVALCLWAPVSPAMAGAATPSAELTPGVDYVPGELVVRYRARVTAAERSAVRAATDVQLDHKLPVRQLELVKLEAGKQAPQVVAELVRRPEVLYAEPNYIYRAQATPNDPGFGQLWGMNNTGQDVAGTAGLPDADIDAPEAWSLTTGSAAVTVGIVDSGADIFDHPDIEPNVWVNPGEWPGFGGIDDDGNGHVDDISGWDWVGNDMYPLDLNGHGTHVAGTTGGRGNNGVGVVGVNWQVSMMILRVLDANAQGSLANIVSAFNYAGAKGAKVVNASLGGPQDSQAMRDAIGAAPNTLFVVAAGNGGADGIGDNNDVTPEYPCNIPASNLICVAAVDQVDNLASFSNYGTANVDLAAPGKNVLSSVPAFMGYFDYYPGTSMASPHVAGTAALFHARYPGASPATVRAALLGSVDVSPCLQGKLATGGRLNAYRALGGSPPQASTCGAQGGASPPPPAASPATPGPAVAVTSPRAGTKLSRRKLARIAGTIDPAPGVAKVALALERRRGRRCAELTAKGMRRGKCSRLVYLSAKGTASWSLRLSRRQRRTLRPGKHTLHVRALDAAGNPVDLGPGATVSFSLAR